MCIRDRYNDNSTELQIPADLPKETIEQIREYAVRAFKALDGSGLSRVDFFVKHSDGSVVSVSYTHLYILLKIIKKPMKKGCI